MFVVRTTSVPDVKVPETGYDETFVVLVLYQREIHRTDSFRLGSFRVLFCVSYLRHCVRDSLRTIEVLQPGLPNPWVSTSDSRHCTSSRTGRDPTDIQLFLLACVSCGSRPEPCVVHEECKTKEGKRQNTRLNRCQNNSNLLLLSHTTNELVFNKLSMGV